MRTREQKWKRYRERIERLPDSKFPVSEDAGIRPLNPADLSDLGTVSTVAKALDKKAGKAGGTPYVVYLKRRRIVLFMKVAVLAMAITAFVIAWFLLVV